ncbi:hypothetical protein Glove_132g30 [Diversispora epigaea]|uniref:Uncharacterized protein n=1 Tax=Diversispora epigaea TaxID=1348612 RepID=A0A397J1W6_9GLOM|nr:hypothetical protein Glove_132g30 [Diversispora epigaea]
MTSATTKATIDYLVISEKINGDNNHESQNVNNVISSIVRQISGKKIQISLRQLLKLVKPEIHQEIINAIAIPKRKCKVPREKSIVNRGSFANGSSSSPSSESESGSGSSSDEMWQYQRSAINLHHKV